MTLEILRFPNAIKTEISPSEIKTEVSPSEIKTEVSPSEIKTEVSHSEINIFYSLNQARKLSRHVFV